MWEKILKNKFDRKDIEIISVLNQDGRISDQKMAERLGISKTAIRTRRLKLQKMGAIRIIALLVLQNIELVYADVVLSFESGADKELIKKFIERCANDEYIFEISEYMGTDDLLLRFFDSDLSSLKDHIVSIIRGNGIISSYLVYPVVRSYKAWGNVLNFKDSNGK